MRVLMLETRRGTEDGYTIRQYQSGETYALTDTLARAFLAAGFATPVDEGGPKKPKSAPRKKRTTPRLVKE